MTPDRRSDGFCVRSGILMPQYVIFRLMSSLRKKLIPIFVLVICLASVGIVQSQPSEKQFDFDSLEQLVSSSPDTVGIKMLFDATYALRKNFPDSALSYGQRALERSKIIGFDRGIAESYNNLGAVFIIRSEYDTAVSLHRKSIEYYQKLGDEKGRATALNNIGHIEQERGNYEAAAEVLLESIQLNEQIGNDKILGSNYINLGLVMSNLGQADEAISYYRKAIPLKEASEDFESLGNIYNNLGIEFRVRDQLDSAEYFYRKAIHYRINARDYYALAGSYNNLGILYYYLDKPDSTAKLFHNALQTYQAVDDKKEIARSYFNIAELHRMQGRYGNAITNLELALASAKQAKSKEQLRDIYKGLSRVNASNGNYEKAYEYRLSYEDYEDSLRSDRTNRMVTEMSTKYQTAEKDREIAALNLDQQTAALALANSQNQRNIFISGFIIFFIAAGFLLYRYNTKRKTSNLLTEKNQQISLALEERETLLKEIHHRVKNNLQVISSLLNLQAGSLKDEAAVDAVKEGQNRVKSMALIHQKLYSAEDIRGVDVQDYLENLTSELFSAFGVQGAGFEIDASGIKLDIDTVIPLGLIINELITNTIKYAFVTSHEGLLEIQIREEGDKLNVMVRDNGAGMDAEALEKSNSFGWKMIRSLSRKVKAEINILNDQGTTVQMTLSRYKLVV